MRTGIWLYAAALSLSAFSGVTYAGCTSDSQCKGDRVCEAGECVDPSSAMQSGGSAASSEAALRPGMVLDIRFGMSEAEARAVLQKGGYEITRLTDDLNYPRRLDIAGLGSAPILLGLGGHKPHGAIGNGGALERVVVEFTLPPKQEVWSVQYLYRYGQSEGPGSPDSLIGPYKTRLGEPVDKLLNKTFSGPGSDESRISQHWWALDASGKPIRKSTPMHFVSEFSRPEREKFRTCSRGSHLVTPRSGTFEQHHFRIYLKTPVEKPKEMYGKVTQIDSFVDGILLDKTTVAECGRYLRVAFHVDPRMGRVSYIFEEMADPQRAVDGILRTHAFIKGKAGK